MTIDLRKENKENRAAISSSQVSPNDENAGLISKDAIEKKLEENNKEIWSER